MKELFVVTEDDHEGDKILGVFSTQMLAHEFCKGLNGDIRINKCCLDQKYEPEQVDFFEYKIPEKELTILQRNVNEQIRKHILYNNSILSLVKH